MRMRTACSNVNQITSRPESNQHSHFQGSCSLCRERTTSSVVVIFSLSSSQSNGLQGAAKLMISISTADTPTARMLPVSSGPFKPAVATEIEPDWICVHASQDAMPHALPTIEPAAQIHRRVSLTVCEALVCAHDLFRLHMSFVSEPDWKLRLHSHGSACTPDRICSSLSSRSISLTTHHGEVHEAHDVTLRKDADSW